MLLYTKDHHVKSLTALLAGEEGAGSVEERQARAQDLKQRIADFASDETGLAPGCEVWCCSRSEEVADARDGKYQFTKLVEGQGPKEGQRVVYVDGGFDLFSSGHIRFLQLVHEAEEEAARARGWDDDEQRRARIDKHGKDFRPAYVVAGIHDDETVHRWKGASYPIMNIIERGLCVLQCKVSPFLPSAFPQRPQEAHRSLKRSQKKVHRRHHLLSPIHSVFRLPHISARWDSSSRLPRPDIIHANTNANNINKDNVRRLRGRQRNGSVQADRPARVRSYQCRGDCQAHLDQP